MTTDERIEWLAEQIRAELAAVLAEPEPIEPDRESMGGSEYIAAWREYHRDLRAWKHRQRQAAEGIAPLRLAGWLGRAPSPSETTLFSRAYAAGESRGLWRCLKHGRRTWALQAEGLGDG